MPEEEPRAPDNGIIHRAHTFELAIKVLIGVAVAGGAFGSLVAQAYGNLSFGITLVLAAILALVITQLPMVVPWGRQRISMLRSRYPWISALIAALLVFFVLFYEYRPGERGEQGPRGAQGPPGPPGPPGSPDPRVETIVRAMARLPWLEQRYAEFRETRDRYISEVQNQLDYLNSGKPVVGVPRAPTDEYLLTQKMSQMAKDDLGQPISLGDTPQFGSTDLSRVTADFNKAKIGIGQIDELYNQAIQTLRLQILSFGKAVPNSSK